ncbi:hypothetical protein BT93_L4176 [Corymbia citriodora subsp. variegata]|uniref:Zn(2)-C6 fungal-type domain-containing protein n=1 Tax=Corymbia citriodora subsp. variegata TaxID=360336 RepID=A0A8T0CGB7_CORYI|nr:hypothetical protein BT93_L4176 [Corymbia citriodora subsp. variegata]
MATPQHVSPISPGVVSESSRSRSARTSHACDRCRLLRAKCTGERACTRCANDRVVCVYSDRKRERNKKYVTPCNVLYGVQAGESTPPIASTSSTAEATPEISTTPLRESAAHNQNMPDRDPSADSSNLTYALDLGRGNGAAGFLGRTSATAWMLKVADRLDITRQDMQAVTGNYSTSTRPERTNALSTEDFKFYDDEQELLLVNEDFIDACELPPQDTALVLTRAFFEATSPTFRFCDQDSFYEKTYRYTDAHNVQPVTDMQYLAQANMVWAVGAHWLKVHGYDTVITFHDHSYFYARARALGVDHRVHIDRPCLVLLSALGILSYYLFTNGSITRAFNITGVTIRHAVAYGLHLESAPGLFTAEEIRYRAKLWYSLLNLEILLASMTGRPKCIMSSSIGLRTYSERLHITRITNSVASIRSRQLWRQLLIAGASIDPVSLLRLQVLQEEESNEPNIDPQDRIMNTLLDLQRIDDDVNQTLYSVSTDHSWEHTQERIIYYDQLFHTWRTNLPATLDWTQSTGNAASVPTKLELAVKFLHSQLVLHYVVLSRISATTTVPNPRASMLERTQKCSEAALELLRVLSSEQGQGQAWQVYSWWQILHPVCLALAAVLFELCLEKRRTPSIAAKLVSSLPQFVDLLLKLSQSSKSASRALVIFQLLIDRVQHRYAN